ncbi:beta-Ig-H3/fasciclin [Fibrisoma limi BUZ 3]|uniref:Beta-Ig-H3/fasciclin n=1 Tax=Fibrisoma limi BUZ 3 TaxID=1185876 RepID=I2GM91_9BACT|nr:fasciclin domain-containing protein [Fibrisoma limi]CCH55018.1 beta-Ig-H3/fasciclin [Fibrisoma limi BUZ 3]
MRNRSNLSWALALAMFVGINAGALAQSQNTMSRSDSTGTTSMGSMSESGMKPGGSTGKDLAISAAKSADHTILFRALRVSGLTDQAAGKGPYTVFAPTNDAFGKLPSGTLDELMKPAAKKKLVNLLAGHVVKGKYSAEDLQDGQKLKTVTGKTLTVSKQGETVTISDAAGNTATVNQADIEATNGVIHSIDTVLAPAN